MQELTLEQKAKVKKVFLFCAERIIYLAIITVALYIVFAGNLPAALDTALLKAVINNDFSHLRKLASSNFSASALTLDNNVTQVVLMQERT